MTTTFTQNDVIQFLYNEVSESEKQEIASQLLINDEMANEYYELEVLKAAIDKSVKEPSQKTLDNILNFSKSFSLQSVK